MKITKIAVASLIVCGLVSCESKKATNSTQETVKMENVAKAPFVKKYTNKDFYVNGKFNADVALKSYMEMFEYYGVPFTDFMKENFWISDFELGDFEHAGMAGVFWVNDEVNRHFGHEIYLLPGQMIPEHRHEATAKNPAKFESWMIRNGSAYNFGIGEPTPNAPKLPESQKDAITVSNFVIMKVGDILPLKESLSSHFLRAGDNGAIISEFGTYQDSNGLKFTNKKAVFTDVLRP